MKAKLGVLLIAARCAIHPAVVQGHGASTVAPQPEAVPLSEAILGRLPAEYRDKAISLVTATEDTQQRWLKLSDEDLAGAIIAQLGRKSEVAEFLLTQLDKESSAKLRGRIIGSLGGYWAAHPQSQEVLEHHASSDPDAGVALQALEHLR